MKKVQVVELKNLKDPKELEKAIAEAVEKMNLEDDCDEIPEEARTEADAMTDEQLLALKDDPDFKAFHKQLTEKINDLEDFIGAHRKKYNCSILVGVVSAMNKNINFGNQMTNGRNDSVEAAFKAILRIPFIKHVHTGMVFDQILESVGDAKRHHLARALQNPDDETTESSTPQE